MSILGFISGLVKPVTKLIDDLHTSGEEKGKLVNALTKIENEMSSKLLDYESKLLENKTKIITAEAQGQSWLQRNWRPITALTMLALVVGHYLGLLAFPIADQAWTLLQLCIGGYIGGRTVEKIAPSIMDKFGKNK